VLPRYALQEVLESRVLAAFLMLCLVPFLVELALVYLANNAPARALLRVQAPPADLLQPQFFLVALTVQGFLAFFLTAWVAPFLVSPDLVNGALPLYLSRPFTRGEYVLGKATALFCLLSVITWVPVGIVFSVEAGLAESGWLAANLRIPAAILGGAFLWISVLTLLGLALSAWIRWRIVASGALFGILFMGSAFGEAWREMLRNPWGRLTNLPYLIGIIWTDLFGLNPRRTLAREMLDDGRSGDLPVWVAWLALLAVCAFCLWLLDRRLRAREVYS
jgi:ABC-type transport system involved in multi-copper enzyme maturation permease subunit